MAVLGRVTECLAVMTIWLSAQVCTFNLEPRLPVIKQGDRGSYFGYSVAEHLILEPASNVVSEQVLLIGAPRAQTTQPGTNRSGAVYRCPISSWRKDCHQIQIDQQNVPPDNSTIKDDQWLGVTVKSQGPGKHVMACAHRYVSRGVDYQWGLGICYSLTPYLDVHQPWEPCLNRPVSKAHEQFGYCQAGTSGDISEDNNIIIGSPGPYTWRGTVFTNSVRFQMRDDKTWYMGPLSDEAAPVDKYSYLGMSVTSGKFFGDATSFVSGAPRSKGTGQVVFFKKQKGSSLFKVELILDGEQFASSFGYSLTSLDIDNNGLIDLVVGAPFYYDKNEGGAIYIYMNHEEGLSRKPEKLTGKPESRYGFAIASAGDINRDGYVDLAVGAPYEGQGAVYIYLGSPEGLRKEPSQIIYAKDLPKQVLSRVNITTFGYSLSGGMDMDRNGYSDLLVGAYDSDAAILLRARPIINIITSVKGKLTNIDPSVLGCPADRDADLVCFSFQACFQFNSSVLSEGTSIKLRYRIEAETFTGKKYYRVTFGSSLKDTPNVVTKDIRVKEDNVYKLSCFDEIVYLKNKSDIQNPIKFKMTYSLIQKDPVMPSEGIKLPDINQYPILNQVEASKVFEAKFLKACGSNEICECDLHLEAELNLQKKGNIFEFPLGEKFINMSLKISNTNESAYDATVYVTHSPSLTYGNKKMIKGDPVNCIPMESVLKCELNNPMESGEVEFQIWFSAKNILPEEKKLHFEVKVNTTSVELTPEDDLTLDADVIIVAELELRGGHDKEQIFYGGEVVGETGITYLEDIGSPVDHTYFLINNGPAKVSSIEIVFSWPYEVANKGEEGKWILYMTEVPEIRGNGFCKMQPGQVNPLRYKKKPDINLTGEEEGLRTAPHQRKKREVVIKPEELRMEGKMVKIVTMDCDIGTAQCFNFSCFIKDLDGEKSARIVIRSRLWSSTFVSDYRDVNFVRIISRGGIHLDPKLGIKQKDLENDRAMAESKVQPDKSLYQKPEPVPLWIIILAVCGGVLLLIIVILCLWKFGFFKRRKPGYMPAETSDKEKEANNI
uniref:Integrin alpha-ps n=1 Tax=Centruroides hentzi TaxID=88313 RepID=A0A2I9LP33_9SCOR